MKLLDGRGWRGDERLEAEVVIIGSGPAGAAVARAAASAGADVLVLEEGPMPQPAETSSDSFGAMSSLYRDMGVGVTRGKPAMALLQGRAVGGTSVVNGAISWRLPEDVFDGWRREDPALAEALPWEWIEAATDEVEAGLHITPTDPAVAGRNNTLLARGAEALGLAHRPIRRNVRDCEGLGRCLQGCPVGAKQSLERTWLPEACERGARVAASVRVERIETAQGRAVGVTGRAEGGARVSVRATHAVVLAASAVQSPALLLASGIRQGPVGRHFQCHPGVAVAGRFGEPVRMWTGATQGHEVTGLRGEGLKFEALGYDLTILAARLRGFGVDFARELERMHEAAHWGCAVRAESEGRVVLRRGRPVVRFDLGRGDLFKVRRGVRVLGELLFAAGAEQVEPGVFGMPSVVTGAEQMRAFEDDGPLLGTHYSMAVTHLFGTCRMGSDPATSVVRPDFRHHHIEGLYVADSSVFPSNTGVNPQTSILALATLCGRQLTSSRAPDPPRARPPSG
ncbi:MAG TPA: GMC family oxidoreductase [Myxococcota bacterium]|nr:GMC family oxidoreductase [Myxococcota bacterium]